MTTLRGADHPRYCGSSTLSVHGYRLVRVPLDHHLADYRGFAYEHLMVAEEMLGRPLFKLHADRLSADDETVHHINFVRTDNEPENIQVLTRSEHSKLHVKFFKRDERGRFLSLENQRELAL